MSDLTRRTVLGGAAAGVAATTLGAVGVASAESHREEDHDGPVTSETVVARVRDARTGEITLYVGTEEISYTDQTLARRIARAATAR